METIEIKEYVNVEKLQERIKSILKNELESFRNKENSSVIDEEFSDKYLEEYSLEEALKANLFMKKYLHEKNNIIDGNINNVDYDYNYHINGEVEFNAPLLEEMIKRLDCGENSDRANQDRNFLNDWLFDTFGTFGIKYNFGELVCDTIYEKLQEKI